MRSEIKCDVEISISADGEDFETIQVPPCLQAATLGSNETPLRCSKDAVRLPKRYVQRLYHARTNKEYKPSPTQTKDSTESREKDLDTALKWIKQEIMEMKEQDKSLMKQFIDLRSTIVQLRCMFEVHSSSSDISSMSGSNMSLDDLLRPGSPMGSPNHLSPIADIDESTEFRSRTSSLLTPSRKSPITRIKWKSNEFI
ncbi:uncharacterized protein LOC132556294 [Ylistrum balloti]|uniref:uncharacterized protein LOC132556294 n=1 Tax=Ylistrum balloti TaxID=509963 RepID=UPI002905EE83|nr:uncharacterized protein LOC132556294 [Ylistrum balloti]